MAVFSNGDVRFFGRPPPTSCPRARWAYPPRAMKVDLPGELRREIAEGRVTCIIGAGVSVAASGGARTASWIGLLRDGIERCTAVVPGLAPRWPDRMRDMIELGTEGDTEALLSVAEQITVKLGGLSGGELKRWLRETLSPEAMPLRFGDVPHALAGLGVPLLTTNYDDLLEAATGLRALDWKDTADVERVLRGEDRAIVHLHGYWRRSESLVLGVRSYEEVVKNAHAQAVLRALRMTKTLLFVGFGAGLEDPNFGGLLRWTREVFHSSEVRHFRLARAEDVVGVQAQHRSDERMFVLSYGTKFEELAPFLTGLAPSKPAAMATPGGPAPTEPGEIPRPRILVAGPWFGVPEEMRPELLRIWNEEPKEKALARIRAKIRRAEVRHAQIAAILHYDVILDLSPWRAFAGRWSLGLRDVEREVAREGAPVPLLYMAWPEGELPAPDAVDSGAALHPILEHAPEQPGPGGAHRRAGGPRYRHGRVRRKHSGMGRAGPHLVAIRACGDRPPRGAGPYRAALQIGARAAGRAPS